MQDRIREILSELLMFEVTDPALQGLTVTEVTLDREIEHAQVYVNALGDEDRRGEIMAGLQRANGYLRREVGSRVRLRRVPVLHFHWDETLDRAEAVERVFDRLREAGELPPLPKRVKPADDDLDADDLEDTADASLTNTSQTGDPDELD